MLRADMPIQIDNVPVLDGFRRSIQSEQKRRRFDGRTHDQTNSP
jgi:hypothetical protein